MIVYSGTKGRFHSDVITNDIGHNFSTNEYAEHGAWQHQEIHLKPLNPECADIVIPSAEAEEFMVVAEVVGNIPVNR